MQQHQLGPQNELLIQIEQPEQPNQGLLRKEEEKAKRILQKELERRARIQQREDLKLREKRLAIKLFFLKGLTYVQFVISLSFYFFINLIATGAAICLICMILLALITFSVVYLELLLLSLITISATILITIAFSTLSYFLYMLLSQKILKTRIQTHLNENINQAINLVELIGLNESSLAVQSEVVRNAFHYVKQVEHDDISEFLADFVIKSCQQASERVSTLISFMFQSFPGQNAEREEIQRWCQHHSAFIRRILDSKEASNSLKKAIIVSYISAFFRKEGDARLSDHRRVIFYEIFLSLGEKQSQVIGHLSGTMLGMWHFGVKEQPKIITEAFNSVVNLSYETAINLGKQINMHFTEQNFCALLRKGLAGIEHEHDLKNGNKEAEYLYILKIILLEIHNHSIHFKASHIVKECVDFYIDQNFYQNMLGLFNYLKENNKAAYLKCRQLSLGYLIRLDFKPQHQGEVRKALIYLYKKYPHAFSKVVDQILEGNRQKKPMEILQYFLQGLDAFLIAQTEIREILNEKLMALKQGSYVFNSDFSFFKNLKITINADEHSEIQDLTLDMEGWHLRKYLFELNEKHSGGEDEMAFEAVIYTLCELDNGKIDRNIQKIADLFIKIIQDPFPTGFFANTLDIRTQALLDRIVNTLHNWSVRLLNGSTMKKTESLFLEIYRIVAINIYNPSNHILKGLKESYWKIGICLDELNEGNSVSEGMKFFLKNFDL